MWNETGEFCDVEEKQQTKWFWFCGKTAMAMATGIRSLHFHAGGEEQGEVSFRFTGYLFSSIIIICPFSLAASFRCNL